MGILMETTEVNLVTAGYRGHRRSGVEPQLFAMGTPSEAFYSDTLHTIAINTRETDFGSIVEPIPITLKTYQQLQPKGHQINGFGFPSQHVISALSTVPRIPDIDIPSTSRALPSPAKEQPKDSQKERITRPPKKKWIKEYLEEEPRSPERVVIGLPVTPRSNGVVRTTSPLPAAALQPEPAALSVPLPDFAQEHSRPRTMSNSHGTPQIPSPPSVGSNGSSNGSGNGNIPRAGTREVHNKLEKNRRAHLKECFELLKRQLPSPQDDKKSSNLSILGSAIRYIQLLRRKERECEHEMERLAREKIASQQRLAALKRDVTVRAVVRPRSIEALVADDKEREETMNGQVLGIPLSITSSPPNAGRMEASPPRTLNLSTKLRTLPIQITPTTSQVVRTTYGARHNTLTLTTLASPDSSSQGGAGMSGLVHPAQIHLPLSQVVHGGGLVVGGAALQLLSAANLRVLPANGVTTGENNRVPSENGVLLQPPVTTDGGSVVVSGLTPIVVSQSGAHMLPHTIAHKMVETQVTPLTVSAQYLSTAIVKPVVVVSSHSPSHS